MSPPNEFWITFHNKRFDLNKINEGDNRGALDKDENLKILFNFFDLDDSGELEEKEIAAFIDKIKKYQNKDGKSIFSASEQEEMLCETREFTDKSGNTRTVSLKDLGINRKQLLSFIKPIIEQIGNFNGIPHEELEAIDFLSASANNGEQALEAYKDTHGIVAETVNIWRTVFNQRYTKTEADSNVKTTQYHVQELTKAAKKSERAFTESYERLRQVPFNTHAIDDCKVKSQTYASAKTTHDMVNYLKDQIYMANGGKSSPVVLPQEAAASIIQALNMCGIKDRNQIDIILHNISENQKNNPSFSKYGGNLRLEKNRNGQWVIYRNTPNGYPDTATPEQLNCVVQEVVKMLEKQYALAFYIAPDSNNKEAMAQKAGNLFNTQEVMDVDKAYSQLGFIAAERGLTAEEFQLYTEIAKYKGMNDKEYSEMVNKLLDNMSLDEMNKLNTNITDYYKQEYDTAFATAYGGEDPEKIAQLYIEKEQQGVQYIQTGLNLASMALMFIPGGALASAPGWLAKGVQVAKTVTPFLMVTHPVDFLEKWTSNGISKEEFNQWFMSCTESALFMGVGMGVGKLAECFSSVYKAKALVTFLKGSGKSVDEITAIIKANPLKFPEEVVEGLKHIDKVAKTLQISTETAMDLSSTYALTKQMRGEGLTAFDWIQSVASAVAGSTLQKQFAPMSTEAKIDFLVKAFEDFNLSREDAARVLAEMDKVSAGEYDAPKTKNKPEMGLKEKPDDVVKDIVNNEANNGNNHVEQHAQTSETKVSEAVFQFRSWLNTSENIGFTFDAAKNKYMIGDERLHSIEAFINKKMDGDAFATRKCMDNLVRTLTEDDIKNIDSMLNTLNSTTSKRLLGNPDELLILYSNLKNSTFFKYGEVSSSEWQVVQNILDNPIQVDDLASLMRYKGTGYKNINKAMIDAERNGTPIPEHLQTEINNIERAIASQTIHEPLTVYRTGGMSALDNVMVDFYGCERPLSEALQMCNSESHAAQLGEYIKSHNCVATNESFTSTSMFRYKAVGTVEDIKLVWEIEVQPDSQGIYIEGVNYSGKLCKEREFILQKNAKLEITNIEQRVDGLWCIKAKATTPQKTDNNLKIESRFDTQKTSYEAHIDKNWKSSKTNKVPEAEIGNATNGIITAYSHDAESMHNELVKLGFDGIGSFKSRVKSYSSLYDKIKNYLDEHPEAKLEDAIADVRDAFGARTVIESKDLSKHPEVTALMKAGNRKAAILRAAEIQSQPAVDMLKEMIQAQADGKSDYRISRLSNYVSEDGIPYFSERQLADLKQFAADRGIKINFVERINKNDDAFKEIDQTNYKPTTKSQPSGYTAFQMNLTTNDGKVIEWQLRGDRINEFAEGEHIAYDIRTNKNFINDNELLRPLYEPIQSALCKEGTPEVFYERYTQYLSDYYTYLRELELGFESKEPNLKDYEVNGIKFDNCLEAQNLIILHHTADDLTNGRITQEGAVKRYKHSIE